MKLREVIHQRIQAIQAEAKAEKMAVQARADARIANLQAILTTNASYLDFNANILRENLAKITELLKK